MRRNSQRDPSAAAYHVGADALGGCDPQRPQRGRPPRIAEPANAIRKRQPHRYNAAVAMTVFTRDDGSGTAVNNAYTFNTLYQMTNQTATQGGATLQNLSYVFPTTNNNGQIFQQIDHLSGEAVQYLPMILSTAFPRERANL